MAVLKKNREGEVSVLVIDGSSSQHHGVVVGPFRGVAPPLLVAVPEVAASRVANNAVRETLPHREGKVHLNPVEEKREVNTTFVKKWLM